MSHRLLMISPKLKIQILSPCNHKGLAFTYGHHSETNNYRPACVRTGLAAPRRPSLVIQNELSAEMSQR
jgi:hypothetical protein